MTPTNQQQDVAYATGASFLIGTAGTGKTTALYGRLQHLLAQGVPAYSILVLVGERIQENGFLQTVQAQGMPYADLKITHYPALVRDMVTLFWPLVAQEAGFASAYQPPTFLGYDLAQLLMWRTVRDMLEDGAFADLRRRPQQIVSQLLDTLNRAAQNNTDIFAATRKQRATWTGDPNQLRHLEHAEEAATYFRQVCLNNNLLDLSLMVDVFNQYVLTNEAFSRYFSERYQHIIVDNVEEQTPAAQKFIEQLMQTTQSAAISYDDGGGYRWFLAADPQGSRRFELNAQHVYRFEQPLASTAPIRHVAAVVEARTQGNLIPHAIEKIDPAIFVAVIKTRYRREMVIALADKLAKMIHEEDVPADEIAVVMPYLDGSVHHVLTQAFKRHGVPLNLVRRRAAPREEPHVRAWLTWVALAHPDWGVHPTAFDVAEALGISFGRLDPIRAAILADAVYPQHLVRLIPAAQLDPIIVARVGEDTVAHYEHLRVWLEENRDKHDLDHFIYHLFADVLATADFQPEPDLAAAGVCDWLVKMAGRLVDAAAALKLNGSIEIGQAFLHSINQGLVTGNPPEMGDPPDPDGVFVSTIYGYLLRGKAVRYQVWMDAGATGWWDYPRQPLSNAFVLAESWDDERQWTPNEENRVRQSLVTRFAHGLTSRCKEGIILATSDLDRRGQFQDGPLWRALQVTNDERRATSKDDAI